MSYYKIPKEDIYLRRAMWECYHKKCVYCGIALEVRHMHVDHILPVDENNINNNDDLDLKIYIAELHSKNFEKNSVQNYILSCSDCNNKKRNYTFNANNFRFYHEYAERHSAKIIQRIQKYKSGVEHFTHTPISATPNIKYSISDLTCEKQVISYLNQVRFKYGLGEVRIDAFLPCSYDKEISCLISFKELYQSNIFITYAEKDIVEYLFSGYKTKIEDNLRRWYIHYNLPENDVYEINLPNIKLQVSYETILQMANICDVLYEEYLLQELHINTILGSTDFPAIDKGSYKLLAIRNDILEIFISYIKKHQYDVNDNIEYNIFHLTNNYKHFYLHQNLHSSQDAGIYACINLLPNGDYHDIIWSPGTTGNQTEKMQNFDNTNKWTADFTYDKLISNYIPAALEEHDLNSRSFLQYLFSSKTNTKYDEAYLINSQIVKSYKEL